MSDRKRRLEIAKALKELLLSKGKTPSVKYQQTYEELREGSDLVSETSQLHSKFEFKKTLTQTFTPQISTQALVSLRNDNWLVEANFPRGTDQSEALFRSGKWQVISMEFLQPSSFRGKPVAASWDVGCFPRLASDVFMHCLLSKKFCSPRHYGEHQGLTLIAALSQGCVQIHPLTTWCGNSSQLHLNKRHSICCWVYLHTAQQGRIQGEGAGGAHPPPWDDLRPLSN